MEKVTVKTLFRESEKYLDKEVIITGWVKKIRAQKNFGFMEVNDGSFFKGIQVVFDNKLENFEEISHLSIISTVEVKGKLVKSLGKGQDYEIAADTVDVFQKADLSYPLQNKRHTFEYLRNNLYCLSLHNLMGQGYMLIQCSRKYD